MEDKISIIIPVYKVEKYLRQCVNSVLNQTYKNLEIILVDDGSPDACPQICDDWAKKDERIKVVHKQNGGVSSARNAGLKIATGNYIVWVDSDDLVHEKYVETLYNTLQANNADIAMCNWQKFYDINKPPKTKIKNKDSKTKIFNDDEVFGLLFNKKVPMIMTVWAKIYKKEIFRNIQFYEGVVQAEDDKIMTEILNECKKLVYINDKLYYNLLRSDSLTGVKFSEKRMAALDILKERIEFTKANKPQYTDDSIYYFMKISILYYYYAKWAGFGADVLTKIKEDVLEYYNRGYKNKITKMFVKHPKIMELILKIRERFKIK